MLDLDAINIELAIAAEVEREERVEQMYQDFLEEMYYYLEMEQYAADSYDRDAEFYGYGAM